MTEEGKKIIHPICPLLTIKSVEELGWPHVCKMEQCQWYDQEGKCCAIKTFMIGMKNIADELHIFNNRTVYTLGRALM